MTDSEKYYGELLVVKDHTEEDFRRLWAEEYCRKEFRSWLQIAKIENGGFEEEEDEYASQELPF